MEIKKIIITGDERELNFITRILCGIHCLTINSGYRNSKKEGLMFLETRVKPEDSQNLNNTQEKHGRK